MVGTHVCASSSMGPRKATMKKVTSNAQASRAIIEQPGSARERNLKQLSRERALREATENLGQVWECRGSDRCK
jgi:hypothetical protein